MEEIWISVAVILVAIALLYPEDLVIFSDYVFVILATLKVEVHRRWMMARIWPRLQYDRIRLKRMARTRRMDYNSKANHQSNHTHD